MHSITVLGLAYLSVVTIQVIYRLFLHPLRKFPGPWLAASTYYYRAYYNVIKGGGWTKHMVELHEQYGPVVRVTPHELHFSDPKAFDDIHAIPRPLKDHHFYRAITTQDALVTILDPKEASKRRVRIGSYFSRKAVIQLEKMIGDIVDKLIVRLTADPYSEGSQPADLLYAYRAVTMDIIMSYLFVQEFGAIDYPGFAHPLLVCLDGMVSGTWVMYHLHPLGDLMQMLPESILRKLNPIVAPFLDQIHRIAQKVEELTAKVTKDTESDNDQRTAVFHVWLDKTSGSRKWIVPKSQIMDECTSMQLAGSDPVGNACMTGTFYLLRNRTALTKLRQELDGLGEEMTFEVLEKLPYLTAVIKESLRMSHGVSSPLPRIVGPSGSTVAGVAVPPGTAVSSAAYVIHTNPTIFPRPHEFLPERWVDNRELDKYLVAFSKGPRSCLGINLAWAELYLIFAKVFRRLDFELDDAGGDDLTWSDYFLPLYPGKRLMALVRDRKRRVD